METTDVNNSSRPPYLPRELTPDVNDSGSSLDVSPLVETKPYLPRALTPDVTGGMECNEKVEYLIAAVIILIVIIIIVVLFYVYNAKYSEGLKSKQGFSPENKAFIPDNMEVLNNPMDEVDYIIPAFNVGDYQ